MELIIFWFALAFIAAAIASRKGRSGFGFFLLAVILSPLIGIICALVARPDTERTERQALKEGTARRCPYCAEVVRIAAVKCRHCQSELQAIEQDRGDTLDARCPPRSPRPIAQRLGYALGRAMRRT